MMVMMMMKRLKNEDKKTLLKIAPKSKPKIELHNFICLVLSLLMNIKNFYRFKPQINP